MSGPSWFSCSPPALDSTWWLVELSGDVVVVGADAVRETSARMESMLAVVEDIKMRQGYESKVTCVSGASVSNYLNFERQSKLFNPFKPMVDSKKKKKVS